MAGTITADIFTAIQLLFHTPIIQGEFLAFLTAQTTSPRTVWALLAPLLL